MADNEYIIPVFKTIKNAEYMTTYAKPELQILPRIEEVAYMLHWLKDQGIFFETGNFHDITPNEYYKVDEPAGEAFITLHHLQNANVISSDLTDNIYYNLDNDITYNSINRFEPYITFRSHLYAAQIFHTIIAVNNNITVQSWKTTDKETWSKIYTYHKYTDEYDDYEYYCPFFPSEFSEKRPKWPTPYYPRIPSHSKITNKLTRIAGLININDLTALSSIITP